MNSTPFLKWMEQQKISRWDLSNMNIGRRVRYSTARNRKQCEASTTLSIPEGRYEDKERLNSIWEWSRSINCRKKVSTNEDSQCAICKEVSINSDHLFRCHHCKTPAHESCIATHSSGWAENKGNTFVGNVFYLVK
jgi:hypothetical protein